MKVLFIGDIVGRPGRRILKAHLAQLQRDHDIDLTIANVENSAGGYGILPSIGQEILECGVDVMTSGNHIWDKREALEYIGSEERLLRPANYPAGAPGLGARIVRDAGGQEVGVLNLQGRVFMPLIDCPFQVAARELSELRRRTPLVFVDFHAEATSEKIAFGWHLDGQVTAVIGTHTHVPTADARILPGGTAYISDAGMTGPVDSVIGMKVKTSLERFLSGRNVRFEVAKGPCKLCGVVVEADQGSGKAISIRRLEVED